MSSNNTGQRELVFCHECENEFWKEQHGLTCPSCHSEFTEVIEQAHDPRQTDPPSPPMASHPLHGHNPWAHNPEDAPDPEEEDVRRYEYRSPNGGLHFTTTFVSSSNSGARRSNRVDQEFGGEPQGNPFNLLGQMLSGMARPQEYPSNHFGDHARAQGGPFGPSSLPGRTGAGMPGMDQARPHAQFYTSSGPGFVFSSTGGPGNTERDEMPVNDLHQMLGTLFNTIHPQGAAGGGGNGFHTILSQILNPANAQHGDAVYSNEAFDRVLSQLMEQHQSGNAPGPASEAAIAALPRKPVGARELGDEGKAECSICMDSVTAGVEITVLPCNHWFHPDCVKAWLSEHDTCPVCRAGIMPKDGDGSAPRAPSQAPLHDEDPAHVARRQSGSRMNPFIVPESPSRERRQPSFRRHSSGAGGTRNSPPGSSPRDSSGQHGTSGSSGASGGLTGRMRRMFGSSEGESSSSKRGSSGHS